MQNAVSQIIHKKKLISSVYLNREVRISVFLPQKYLKFSSLPTLLLNDGQDFEQLGLIEALTQFNKKNEANPLVIVAIWANENRLNEYGTVGEADYKKRGNLANENELFVKNELIPQLKIMYSATFDAQKSFIAGFSLGGLSAFDLAWENPTLFCKVGAFSASFWWRSKAYEEGYADVDRIMHKKVREDKNFSRNQKFWFECGTNDEESDRNNNGIIDSIDDTLDLINELAAHSFRKDKDIVYYEIKEGEHKYGTWQRAFPVFLDWLYKTD